MTLRKWIYAGLLIATSCGETDVIPEEDGILAGKFRISETSGYALSLTTKSGQSGHYQYQSEDGSVHATVSESEWDGIEVIQTKSNVSGEDVFWHDSPELSLYLTDASGNLLRGDLAMNPYSYQIYDKYNIDGGGNTYCQNIANSAFFWDEWKEYDKLTGNDKVNFYGYYPRPKDETNWLYVSNSIIDKGSARNVTTEGWNTLQYNLTVDQTDDNISFFDVMCSIPETADNGANRPGNQRKGKDDDIHLAFKHMFSLLEFEIYRDPSYVGSCMISGLSVTGKQVYNNGSLDIKTMSLSYQDGGHTLTRTISEEEIKDGVPFRTEMIVMPTTDEPDGNNPDNDRLVVTCKIDGADYSCPLPDLKLESGKKYKLKLTITPSGAVVFRVWHGASVQIGSASFDAGEHPETSNAKSFKVSSDKNFKILKVQENGNIITPSEDGTYKLNRVEGANTYYNVVAVPSANWYSGLDEMRIHFDGLWNDRYDANDTQTSGATVWNDLTGNSNDGSLVAFNATEESGWTGTGLAFDGVDDILTFPGSISSGDYTIEFYIYVSNEQKKVYPRLLGEDEKNTTGYPSFCLNSQDPNYRLSVCGNGTVNHEMTSPSAIYLRGELSQLDCVYSSDKKLIHFYQNGEYKAISSVRQNSSSIPKASLGNRVQDNTRAMKATYFSFILYDKALTQEEIAQNYEVNKSRYGSSYGGN